MEHSDCKRWLCECMSRNDGCEVSTEKRIGSRRADIAIHYGDENGGVVVEVQHSSISTEEIDARYKDYNDAGYGVLWVVTDDVMSKMVESGGSTRMEYTPSKWIRHLHKIHLGRVYAFSKGCLYSVHFGSVYHYNEGYDNHPEYYRYCKTVRTAEVVQIVDSVELMAISSRAMEEGKPYEIGLFNDDRRWGYGEY